MGLIGGRSGFHTGRDLALFLMGALIAGVHLVSTYADPSQISVPLIVTAGGLMGAPYVLKQDERK